jgi:hypothetical protein
MSSPSAPATVVPPSPETVAEAFARLASTWKKAVAMLSSSRARETHPAYREIIALGQPVVPLLLRHMEQQGTHWFAALQHITGANPVPEEDAGNIPRMVAAWLSWAHANGYQW